jgi:hypothetical protein
MPVVAGCINFEAVAARVAARNAELRARSIDVVRVEVATVDNQPPTSPYRKPQVSLRNSSERTVTMNCAFRVNAEDWVPIAGEVSLTLIDADSGTPLPYAIEIRPGLLLAQDFQRVPPTGTCVSAPIDVAHLFGSIPAGRYNLTVTACNAHDGSEFDVHAPVGCTPPATIEYRVVSSSAK